MISRIKKLFAPPIFEDVEKTRAAGLLHTILLAIMAFVAVAIIAILAFYGFATDLLSLATIGSVVVLIGVSLGLMQLNRRGHVQLASAILIAAFWLLITLTMYGYAGLVDVTVSAYVLTVVMAGVLLARGAALVVFTASMLSAVGLLYVETYNILTFVKRGAEPFDLIILAASLGLTVMVSRYAMRTSEHALERAHRGELALVESNRELESSRASLQESLAALERRSEQLQATVEVSRAAASLLDPQELMWQIAESIQDHFKAYHVGIFRLDQTGQWAEYQAGAGESGRLLAEERFRLEVGGASMIGWCTARAQARVTQDVRKEAQRVDRQEVSLTQSEAALPLIARGQVIGALSVQSDQKNWFDRDTLAALETVSDQVAVALDNARLFADSQQALETAQRAYGQASRQAWADLLSVRGEWGYSYSRGTLSPTEGSWQPEMVEAARTGQRVTGAGEGALAIPLQVRDQVVGVLSFARPHRLEAGEPWTSDEVSLMETMAGQLSVALESAQLFEETQRRASRERLIGEVTARVRETLDVDMVLQTAIREVGEALALAEVEVRMGPGQLSRAAVMSGAGNGEEVSHPQKGISAAAATSGADVTQRGEQPASPAAGTPQGTEGEPGQEVGR